ncbi:transposase [bacterium]|nr:transposase [bacterium]
MPEDDAMGSDSKGTRPGEAFGRDSIEQVMRERIRETIEVLVEEELEAALGAAKSARVGGERVGYRHGRRPRTLKHQRGTDDVRAAASPGCDAAGEAQWRSAMFERYARRTRRGSTRAVGDLQSGTSTRRTQGAAPCCAARRWGTRSRAPGRALRRRLLRGASGTWRPSRSATCFLDGWYPRVHIGKRSGYGPGAGDMGTCADGRRVLLDLRVARARRARPPPGRRCWRRCRSASAGTRCWR